MLMQVRVLGGGRVMQEGWGGAEAEQTLVMLIQVCVCVGGGVIREC